MTPSQIFKAYEAVLGPAPVGMNARRALNEVRARVLGASDGPGQPGRHALDAVLAVADGLPVDFPTQARLRAARLRNVAAEAEAAGLGHHAWANLQEAPVWLEAMADVADAARRALPREAEAD